MPKRWLDAVAASLAVIAFAACGDEPTDPSDVVDINGFRILQGSAERFEWSVGDNQAADTLNLRAGQNMTVRFVWLDSNGDVVEAPVEAVLQVSISNSGAAEWEPHPSDPFQGTFDPGPFPEVETAMRITLLHFDDTLFQSPLLQLHVSP